MTKMADERRQARSGEIELTPEDVLRHEARAKQLYLERYHGPIPPPSWLVLEVGTRLAWVRTAKAELLQAETVAVGGRRPGKTESVEVVVGEALGVSTKSPGQQAYEVHAANHPTIHCNRFAAWDELPASTRAGWERKAEEANRPTLTPTERDLKGDEAAAASQGDRFDAEVNSLSTGAKSEPVVVGVDLARDAADAMAYAVSATQTYRAPHIAAGVIYQESAWAEKLAALVVGLHPSGHVDLVVFPRSGVAFFSRQHVPHAHDTGVNGWHWPTRA